MFEVTMEEVLSRENMLAAYRRVLQQHAEPLESMASNGRRLGTSLRARDGRPVRRSVAEWMRTVPSPVRKVEIPEAWRQRRYACWASQQLLDRLDSASPAAGAHTPVDPTFSRRKLWLSAQSQRPPCLGSRERTCCRGPPLGGRHGPGEIFDRVFNHDVLMSSSCTSRIKDKRILKLIRRLLEAGMHGRTGWPVREREGQGGTISPLLSNVLLDDLDKELERRIVSYDTLTTATSMFAVNAPERRTRTGYNRTFSCESVCALVVNREKSSRGLYGPGTASSSATRLPATDKPKLKVAPESKPTQGRLRENSDKAAVAICDDF